MASTEQARAAVDEVVHRLDEVDDTTRAKIPERSVALLLHAPCVHNILKWTSKGGF